MLIQNKKARFDYYLTDEHTAGMILSGPQVKAIKDGRASLIGAHCTFGNENDVHALFSVSGEAVRIKLLLNKTEIKKLKQKCQVKGFTLVPVNMHTSRGMIKMKIALGKGKKNYDKRQVIKERDASRQI